jgi:pyridoxal 5'-phosphate synthase pdxS subunit
MATELPTTNGSEAANGDSRGQQSVKEGLARMLKGGVIMDVVNAEQVRSSIIHVGFPFIY